MGLLRSRLPLTLFSRITASGLSQDGEKAGAGPCSDPVQLFNGHFPSVWVSERESEQPKGFKTRMC